MQGSIGRYLVALGILCAVGCRYKNDEGVSLRLNALPIGESGRYRLTADVEGLLTGINWD